MARTSLERVSQREYARRLGISNELVSRAVKTGQIKRGWDKGAGKIIVSHANAEWGAIYLKTNVTKLLETEPGESEPTISYEPDYQAPKANGHTLQLTGSSSYADAKRVREIIGAQLAAIELKTRKEELVKKDEVFKQLYAFGQEIRITIMAIPDRCIDVIMATKNRSEAHSLLVKEIHEALESLTKVDFNFQPRS